MFHVCLATPIRLAIPPYFGTGLDKKPRKQSPRTSHLSNISHNQNPRSHTPSFLVPKPKILTSPFFSLARPGKKGLRRSYPPGPTTNRKAWQPKPRSGTREPDLRESGRLCTRLRSDRPSKVWGTLVACETSGHTAPCPRFFEYFRARVDQGCRIG
ncbi:hypothetical protein EJ03DRAFT_101904 [Teratosphaeria nubilosa]|uniref:Uncharacterized protein n=1 Tax=Teratosphaeria nubilosa TaxID=161662 RepID=A0A6G1LKX4_9PEZI|nr:hypothetical protein EJ03DRAFT_101904 [Teratosphaeria nubilosa]